MHGSETYVDKLASSGLSLRRKRALCVCVLGVTTFGIVACTPPHPNRRSGEPLRVVAALDCPERQGDLNLKSTAPDQKTCTYTDGDGTQVTMQIVSLVGQDARSALAPIEAQLKSEVHPSDLGPPTGAGGHDRVDIDLPGVHIHSAGNGQAKIDAMGVHVNADERASSSKGAAEVTVGGGPGHAGVVVNADDSGAQIRIDERGSGLRYSYILASDKIGPHGYRTAGYMARGPIGGPLVVASILARNEAHDDLRHEADALLRRNVGR